MAWSFGLMQRVGLLGSSRHLPVCHAADMSLSAQGGPAVFCSCQSTKTGGFASPPFDGFADCMGRSVRM
ncbi:hypothetical protein ASC91_02095 [Pelomonas sp. Root1237]|nr:hypothetical protein ASC91_02095 [Pelomonas sp. Root1237]